MKIIKPLFGLSALVTVICCSREMEPEFQVVESDSIFYARLEDASDMETKAFVDDKPTDTCCVNERYVGLVVPAGEHKIKIQYEQPFKKAGFLLTLTGVVLFAVIVVITERKKKTRLWDFMPVPIVLLLRETRSQ